MSEERQYLQHGKALCGKVFKGFVATFNWLVDFCVNIKGDADVNDATGKIVVDRTDPAHPVIRCTGCTGGSGGGGGGGGGGSGGISDNDGGGVSVPGYEDFQLFGGDNIRIDRDGNKIMISYDPGKEPDEGFYDDGDGDNGCEHPEGGSGVPAEETSGNGDVYNAYGGGVSAESQESHQGDPCNCE